MSEEIRNANLVSCKKGKILYTINCSPCHDSVSKKRTFIPDFTPEQLSGYEFRFANRSHENNLTESNLTQEELVSIITFLTYKEKSNYLPKISHKDSSELDIK